jgi:hypothetical protein
MANSTQAEKSLPGESVRSNRAVLADIPENNEHRDALYLFACHVEWRTNQSRSNTRNSLRRSTIMTATFVPLQKNSSPEGQRGLRAHTDIETW